MFAEHGFHEASMNQVADAAGVTKPVLYQHFGSKRALYLELLEDVGRRLENAIGKAVSTADGPRQQVQAGLSAFFGFVAHDRAAFTLLFATGAGRGDQELSESVRRVEDTIAEYVAALITVDGLSVERRRLLAYGIVGLTEVSSRRWMEHDVDLDPDVLAAQLAELVWAGLRGIHSPTSR